MIYSVIVCIIFFAALLLWLVRFAKEAGFSLPNNKLFSFALEDKTYKPLGEKTTGMECLKIFLLALGFRIAVFLLAWMAYGIFSDGDVQSIPEFFSNWKIWDAPHYLEIAENGYANHIEDGQYLMLVFFPLFPMLVKILHAFIPNYILSGMIVSTICYSVGCMLMYKLVTMDYSKSIAKKSVVFLSVYPFAFYYGGIMTESTFFMLTIATFLAIRKHNWLVVGILGALTALTRSFGVLMIIPAAVEWVQHECPIGLIREKNWKKLGKDFLGVLPILIIPVGTLIYLYINYSVTGDPFIFSQYQSEHWHMNLQFFGKTLNMLWSRTMSFNDRWSSITCLFMPELLALPVFAAVILYSIRRTRSVYVVFMLIYFAFNAAASWPLSLSRYLSCMFPVFWVLATFTDKHKETELPITAIMAIGFGIYLTGYITLHQIM